MSERHRYESEPEPLHTNASLMPEQAGNPIISCNSQPGRSNSQRHLWFSWMDSFWKDCTQTASSCLRSSAVFLEEYNVAACAHMWPVQPKFWVIFLCYVLVYIPYRNDLCSELMCSHSHVSWQLAWQNIAEQMHPWNSQILYNRKSLASSPL